LIVAPAKSSTPTKPIITITIQHNSDIKRESVVRNKNATFSLEDAESFHPPRYFKNGRPKWPKLWI